MARVRLVLVSAILGLVAGIANPDRAASETIGSVEKVIVYAYGTPVNEPRSPLFVQTPVFANETVETVEDGGLHLIFADNSDFHMGGGSTVSLDRFIYALGMVVILFAPDTSGKSLHDSEEHRSDS